MKYVRQEGIKDCGVCCLYNILKYYGGSIDYDKLRTYTKTNDNGTNIYNIVNASEKIGLIAESYKCEINDLCNLKFPIIAHLKLNNSFYHFVIIDKVVDDEIIIFDPIRGIIKYSFEDFEKEWTGIIITFTKTDNIIKEKETSYLKQIIKFILQYKKSLISIGFISFIVSIFSIINSFFLSELYKKINSNAKVLIVFVIVILLKLIIDYYRNIKLINFNLKLDKDLSLSSYIKILSLPYKYHRSRPVGDIVSRLNDLSSVKNFINELSFSFIVDLFFIIILLLIFYFINKLLFSLSLFVSILYYVIHRTYRDKILYLTSFLKEKTSDINSLLIESILGIDTIKNLNIKSDMINKYNSEYSGLLNINKTLNMKYTTLNLLKNALTSISSIILIFIGMILVKKNIINITDLIAYNTLIIYYFMSLEGILELDYSLINAKEAYKRILKLYKNKEETDINRINLNFSDKITFKNLKYSYDDVNNIFENINFSMVNGKNTFIKGKSGVGKSTIFKLLTKELEVSDNMIFVDGIDINNISAWDIKNNITYVSQNEYIFTGSILDNIKLFNDYTEDEINKVLKICKIDEILNNKNIDLNYILEDNGSNLSKGERQRILLARNLLRSKKVLILDETTNEIDVKSEREIIKNIITEYALTLILISHRTDNSDLFDDIINL